MSGGLPLPVKIGQAFVCEGRKLILQGKVGDRLHITDQNGSVFLVLDKNLGGEALPDETWLWQEFLAGRLIVTLSGRPQEDRRERLDVAAAVVRDPASLKRYTWARMGRAAGLKQNQQDVQRWLDNTPCPDVPPISFSTSDALHRQKVTAKLEAVFAVKPKARAVMEWMKVLKAGRGIGAFVNKAGRPLEHSQLPPKVNSIVGRVTELYYERPEDFPSMEDAAALASMLWEKLAESGDINLGAEAPSYETIRRRIRRNETYANYLLRYGRHAAMAKFAPKGEPIPVTKPFERIFVDGTEFEHYTRYSDEWNVLAGKMKGIAAMDAYSLFRWPYAIFYGPFRPEMSIEALMHVFVPKRMLAEDIESDPTSLIHGVPATIVFDNDRALIPPSLVPNLMLLNEVELIDVYHPNGKSPLEGSFKHDKQRLEKINGQVLPPRRNKDPRYDPAKGAHLTKAQYAYRVEQARLNWNKTPKTSLGDRSPNDVMLEYFRTVGVASYNGC